VDSDYVVELDLKTRFVRFSQVLKSRMYKLTGWNQD